ncbi:bifunctional lysylphosphatidylglycerol flippase/synthetase MprF [Enterococcus sp. LJL90]
MKKIIQTSWGWIKQHSFILKLIFFASVLVFVANQLTHITRGMSWQQVFAKMGEQGNLALVVMAATGLVCILPMLGYDWVTIRTLEKQGKPKMSRREWFVSAWVTNTINNLAGFGGVVGAALRGSFYGKDFDRKKVLATVSKVALFMLSGLSLLSLFTLIDTFLIHPDQFFQEYWIWMLVGSVIAPALIVFAYLNRRRLFKELYPGGIVGLVLTSLGQWCGALIAFLTIGNLLGIALPLAAIYPMFIIATLIGMLTMVPGGVGTFDVLIILGLSQQGIDQNTVVVWLLFYRLFYYVLPFLTGILLFVRQTGVKVNRFFDNLPKIMTQKTAHFVLVAAVYFAGIMMVLLSTISNLSTLSRLFEFLLPFSFDFLDQTINMMVGFLLLGLARGLWLKVRRAFWPTILLLAFGIINAVLRTTSLRLIIVYLIIIGLVWISRKEFYRQKFVYSWGAIIFDSVLFGFLFIVYAIAGYYNSNNLGGALISNRFIFFPSDDVWFSGLVGIGLSLMALALLYQYLADTTLTLGEELNPARLNQLVQAYGGTNASHYLTLPGYRYFYYQENRQDQVVFGFQMKANKCFVLGNPIGDQRKWRQATQAFTRYADQRGYQLAFYKISDDYTLILHDLGYDFAKVGEVGVVSLQKSGRLPFGEALEFKKLTHEGYRFQFYQELPAELLASCQNVSDEWLDGAKEKQFSVGRFEDSYLNASGVGVVFNQANELVGFITQQPISQTTVSFDLLRLKKEVPASLANFLIAKQLDVYRSEGFAYANIGMAPLARVGDSEFSFWEERVMNIIYRYGSFFYEFQTSQQNKEYYVDEWQSRYFAYRSNSSFILGAGQLLMLIGYGKARGAGLAEEVLREN